MNKTIPKLVGCVRCGGTHEDLVFTQFTHKPDRTIYTHFCLCPTNMEPILLYETIE